MCPATISTELCLLCSNALAGQDWHHIEYWLTDARSEISIWTPNSVAVMLGRY
jgi:hypothetical protein